MTTEKQILANRLNALRSTGPKTVAGKRRSRRNAMTHGLTSRTVVTVLENDAEFRAFADEIVRTYPNRSPLEQELVGRLIGLLWRLRRAQSAETGLIAIQGKLQRDIRLSPTPEAPLSEEMLQSLGLKSSASKREHSEVDEQRCDAKARAFLRLWHINGDVHDRLSRYETALWRQAVQTIFLLENLTIRSRSPLLGLPRT